MGRRLTTLRVPVRIARRNAVRARGRTALVALMVGLPIVAASTVAVLFQSSIPTDATYLRQSLGDHAQARVTLGCPMGATVQDARGEGLGCFSEPEEPATTEELEAAMAEILPADLDVTRTDLAEVRLTSDSGTERYNRYGETDLTRPDVAAAVSLHRGRMPHSTDEVLVARATAARLSVDLGDEVAVRLGRGDPHPTVVVGILGFSNTAPNVLALPGTVPGAVDHGEGDPWSSDAWLVTGATPVTWDAVLELNELGLAVTSRAVLTDPPARSEMPYHAEGMDASYVDTRGAALGAVVVGAGLLEAVLLIGPAFAVGARRSARELALLAANGAERRDLRRVVVWSGLTIGAGASAAGATLGVGLGAVLVLTLNPRSGGFPNLQVPWPMVAGFVVVGVLIAVAAAWFPARQASRVDVVAALSGRRSEARPHRALPVAGVVLLGVGALTALAGAARSSTMVTVGGVVLLTVGMVAASGAIVTLVGRLAPVLPLAPRLALRDAARQRSRTAPAVAAVIAAVAGASAGAVYLASGNHQQEQGWMPNAALGTIQVGLAADGFDDPAAHAEALVGLEDAVEDAVLVEDSATVHVMRAAGPSATGMSWLDVTPLRSPESTCPLWSPDGIAVPTAEDIARHEDDPRCVWAGGTGRSVWDAGWGGVLVDDGPAIGLTGLPGAADAARALADGAVVVNSPLDLWPDGTVHLRVGITDEITQETVEQDLVLPGHVVDWPNQLYRTVLPPQAVEQVTEVDMEVAPVGLIAQPDEPLAEDEIAALGTVVGQVEDAEVYVEAPFPYSEDMSILAAVGAAALVGLAATWIAVGLAAAESRADLATLAAVGASPRTRRSVAGAQAGVIAGTGVGLGLATGVLLGAVFVRLQDATQMSGDAPWALVVPWPMLGLVLVGLPTLAVLAAMAVTRSRLPLVRRIAT